MTPMEFDEGRVDAYVATDVETGGPGDWVTDVVNRLKAGSRYGGLPVCDEGDRLLGLRRRDARARPLRLAGRGRRTRPWKVAPLGGLDSPADVTVTGYVQHPLVERTEPEV